MTTVPNPQIQSAELIVRQRRRELTSESLLAFGQKYMPKYFSAPPSSMHKELVALLEEASRGRRRRKIAVAAPRGHAKSTLVTAAYVLWGICTGREKYVVLLSETADLARNHLDSIKVELANNARLRKDFPEVCEEPGVRPCPRRWQESEIETRNGVKVSAHGVGVKIRGRRHKEDRPTLIIADDIESEGSARSEERRHKTRAWFNQAVLHAGAPGANIIVVGTIPHYDSLLSTLIDPTMSVRWTAKRYQAIVNWPKRMDLWQRWEAIHLGQATHEGAVGPDAAQRFYEEQRSEMEEGAQVLWPEREDLLDLMTQRAQSHIAFDAEKQNEPTSPHDCVFDMDKCKYWDDEFDTVDALFEHVGRWGRCYAGCDPAVGRHSGKGDYSALLVILQNTRDGALYVVEADIARRPPLTLFAACIEHQRRYGWKGLGFEVNSYQGWLGENLERLAADEGVELQLNEIESSKDKTYRIQRLQPLLVSGKLQLCRRHTTLMNQLRQFPNGAHDDGPDALEMAYQTYLENDFGPGFEPGDPEYPEFLALEQKREREWEEKERLMEERIDRELEEEERKERARGER